MSRRTNRIFAFLLSLVGTPLIMGAATTESAFVPRLLEAHNAERERVGVPPMRWNGELASSAAVWAEYLRRTGKFEHAPDAPGETPQGENLWAGTKGHYRLEDMVELWVAEKSDYKPGVFPNNSRSGDLAAVGHYTQLIWSNSREVGCAFARGAKEDFLVCRYSRAGNVLGQRPI